MKLQLVACAGWQDFVFLQEIVQFLTRVACARSLAPSQTGSSISALSARLPARWQRRRWESAAFPWQGTGGGRVSASHQSTGRPPPREIRSSDSTGRRLQGRNIEPYCQRTTQPQPVHSHTPVHPPKTHTHTSTYLTLCPPSQQDHRHWTPGEPSLGVRQEGRVTFWSTHFTHDAHPFRLQATANRDKVLCYFFSLFSWEPLQEKISCPNMLDAPH